MLQAESLAAGSPKGTSSGDTAQVPANQQQAAAATDTTLSRSGCCAAACNTLPRARLHVVQAPTFAQWVYVVQASTFVQWVLCCCLQHPAARLIICCVGATFAQWVLCCCLQHPAARPIACCAGAHICAVGAVLLPATSCCVPDHMLRRRPVHGNVRASTAARTGATGMATDPGGAATHPHPPLQTPRRAITASAVAARAAAA